MSPFKAFWLETFLRPRDVTASLSTPSLKVRIRVAEREARQRIDALLSSDLEEAEAAFLQRRYVELPEEDLLCDS